MIKISMQSFTRHVGHGSSGHDLDGEDKISFFTSSSFTGLNVSRGESTSLVFDWDFPSVKGGKDALMSSIFSLKKLTNSFAKVFSES